MIVYNVKRQWFTLFNDADAARKAAGLKKEAIAKVVVENREDLARLLNSLCEESEAPAAPGVTRSRPKPSAPSPAPKEVRSRAKVEPDLSFEDPNIPLFLRKGWAKHFGVKEPEV